jgi:hypothetical protein
VLTPPAVVRTRHPNRDFNPSIAPLAGGRAVVVFQRKRAPAPFRRTAPLWTATLEADGLRRPSRLIAAPVDQAVTSPLAGGRALLTWRHGRRFGAALADSTGRIRRTSAPAGRSVSAYYYVSDVVCTSGRYALFAWADRNRRLRASVRRF